jgi:DNA-binding NarL/FixJ family response regulator
MSTFADSTALVADDHGLYRSGLAFLLKDELGFGTVLEAGSFDEAIEQLEGDTAIGLALFDLHMPGMGGPQSLTVVRDCYPKVRVAIVSGSEQREDVLAALGAGVHGYVAKSLPDAEIASALRSILSGHIYAPRFIASAGPSASAEPTAKQQAEAEAQTLQRLTPRQRDVLRLISNGLSNKEIARKLTIAEGTVKIHLAALFAQLGVKNRTQAAAIAAKFNVR